METLKRNAALYFSLTLLVMGTAHRLINNENTDPEVYGFIVVGILLLPIWWAHRKSE